MSKININLDRVSNANQQLRNIKNNMYNISNQVNILYVQDIMPNSSYINNNVYRLKNEVNNVIYRMENLYTVVNKSISNYRATENRIMLRKLQQSGVIPKISLSIGKAIKTIGKTYIALRPTSIKNNEVTTEYSIRRDAEYDANGKEKSSQIAISREKTTFDSKIERKMENHKTTTIYGELKDGDELAVDNELEISAKKTIHTTEYQKSKEIKSENSTHRLTKKENQVEIEEGTSVSILSKDEDGKIVFDPEASIGSKETRTAYEYGAYSREGFGKDQKMLGYHGEAKLILGKSEKEAKLSIAESGVSYKYTAAELQANDFGFSLLGIDFGVAVGVNAGAGVNAGYTIEDGGFSFEVGASLGIGLDAKINLDVSDFILFKQNNEVKMPEFSESACMQAAEVATENGRMYLSKFNTAVIDATREEQIQMQKDIVLEAGKNATNTITGNISASDYANEMVKQSQQGKVQEPTVQIEETVEHQTFYENPTNKENTGPGGGGR